jgi:hypothetical protein
MSTGFTAVLGECRGSGEEADGDTISSSFFEYFL